MFKEAALKSLKKTRGGKCGWILVNFPNDLNLFLPYSSIWSLIGNR